MKNVGLVQGSAVQAVPLVVGKDTVYVHTDIVPLPPDEYRDNAELYNYREVQYEKDEFIKLMADKNTELEGLMNTLLGVETNG